MKNRLQRLWDEVVPGKSPCPQPDARSVQRRVDQALDSKPRAVRPRRLLRPALAAALAAVLLLTASSILAAADILPPEFNVLNSSFGRGENAADAVAMMTITPVSVSDDNYTMTVTSSLADENKVYFTLLIEAHNDEAWNRLLEEAYDGGGGLLSFRIPGSGSSSHSGEVDPDHERTMRYSASATWIPSSRAAVRLNLMEDAQWLEFPVKAVRSVTLRINASGQGMGLESHAAGGPVELKTVEVSPLSFAVDYTTPKLDQGVPMLYFLYADGTIKTQGQLDAVHPSGHGSEVGWFGGDSRPMRYQFSYQFPAVQDLSQMEAVIFEGMAYPLSGGDPYEVDMSGFVRPFTIPLGEIIEDSPDFSVPFFALCDGLGVPYTWDEETGVASATWDGVTLTFTRDSAAAGIRDTDGTESQWEGFAASTYRDGELWVDAFPVFPGSWDLWLIAAFENSWASGFSKDVTWTDWVVIP